MGTRSERAALPDSVHDKVAPEDFQRLALARHLLCIPFDLAVGSAPEKRACSVCRSPPSLWLSSFLPRSFDESLCCLRGASIAAGQKRGPGYLEGLAGPKGLLWVDR